MVDKKIILLFAILTVVLIVILLFISGVFSIGGISGITVGNPRIDEIAVGCNYDLTCIRTIVEEELSWRTNWTGIGTGQWRWSEELNNIIAGRKSSSILSFKSMNVIEIPRRLSGVVRVGFSASDKWSCELTAGACVAKDCELTGETTIIISGNFSDCQQALDEMRLPGVFHEGSEMSVTLTHASGWDDVCDVWNECCIMWTGGCRVSTGCDMGDCSWAGKQDELPIRENETGYILQLLPEFLPGKFVYGCFETEDYNQFATLQDCEDYLTGQKIECGNQICEVGENVLNCAVDCGYCGDGFCTDEIGEDISSCKADCKVVEPPVEGFDFTNLIIGGIIIVVLAGLGWYAYKRIKK